MPRQIRSKLRKLESTAAAYGFEDFNSDSDENASSIRVSTPVSDVGDRPFSEFIDYDYEPNTVGEEDSILISNVIDNVDDSDDWSSVSTEEEFAGEDIEDKVVNEKLWRCIRANESSKLHVDDYEAILVAIQSVHKISDSAMNVFCKLFAECLPSGHSAVNNSKITRNVLSRHENIDHRISYICSGKVERLSVGEKLEKRYCESKLEKLFDTCRNENCSLSGVQQHSTSFLRFRVRPQIESIVRMHFADINRFLASAVQINGQVGDIPTTPAYSSLGANPDGDTLWISLILSSDGAQAFKCGRSSFWPCVAIIAELPLTVRVAVENAIGLGFWVGRGEKSKPDWNLFLQEIITELKLLQAGFSMLIDERTITLRVRVFATILDLPAQASLWGHKQFNGAFGCISCHHPGGLIWEQIRPMPQQKDHEFFEEAWRRVKKAQDASYFSYYGVTKISPLSRLCNPASVNIFDSMHLVYRGNAHLIINRFFTSQPQKWSALVSQTMITNLDQIIRKIRFPPFFNRKIPSLRQIATFKASEIKNLLMYALLPVTQPFMKKFPDHWHWAAVYVDAIRLLSKPVVFDEDVDRAQLLLDAWQKVLPELCHDSSRTFNSHVVEHLPSQVKKFGPLWSVSAFAFEGYNGHFSRFIKASKGVLMQLARRFCLQKASYQHLSGNLFDKRVCKELFPSLYDRWRIRDEKFRFCILNAIGSCDHHDIQLLVESHFPDFSKQKFSFATRAALGSQIFYSSKYSPNSANVARYSNRSFNGMRSYCEIQLFVQVNDQIYAIGKKLKCIVPTNILQVPPPTNPSLATLYEDRIYGSFYYIVEKSDELELIYITDIICHAILIDCAGALTVTDVLPFEHD